MSNTLPRMMAMLRHIPRHPRKIDTASLLQRLEGAGYRISLRSIQRDLNELSAILPLVSDSAKPQGWSWQAEAEQFHLPFLEPQAALTFHLVQRYLHALLPESTLNYLDPWFRTANAVLAENDGGMTQWPDKVRVLPRGLRLQSPRVDPEVHAALYDALLDERQVMVRYLQRQATEPKEYLVHPLGVVVRDSVIYLVCTMWHFSDVRQLALHRMQSATILEERSCRPEGFSLDAYIAAGAFGYPESGERIALEALFTRSAAAHLSECPLSNDQRIVPADGDAVRVCATVLDTKELHWWLLGFGDQVTVLSPPALRDRMRATALAMAAQYSSAIPSAA
ncbi:helix-turn-helix transcriptional regulator [Noviherbaspirillum pedocola]|uniref:WYL domain-containing protein n=1 Tax=Noviherbaspirillum pedocola TaxID=2801341 RepID=A0A934W7Z6_9BURK|nr:WYL domain-containing protein [Noviherbaspirillum pedocola]MBK4735234.1 WYL domain-containing protein [Noviherbaspirillum pedocola]